MDFQLYRKIIDELSTYDYTVNLGLNFGGESLLHDRFTDMIDYAASTRRFRIGFTTNGMLLSDQVASALLGKIDSISVSLDGLPVVNDSIRTGSRYEVIERNILNIVESRGGKHKPEIDIVLIESTQTSDEILEFVDRWASIVDHVRVYPHISEECHISKPLFFANTPTKQNKFCWSPFRYLAVLWNGDVVVCCHDINGLNVVGSVAKQSIDDAWRGSHLRDLRYAALTNSFSEGSLCYRCDVWKLNFLPTSRRLRGIRATYDGIRITYESVKES